MHESNHNPMSDQSTKSTMMGMTGSAASVKERRMPNTKQSPIKTKKDDLGLFHQNSLDSPGPQGSAFKFKVKDKMAIASFLQGFDYLTEEDIEILASYEEECYRCK